MEGVEVVGRVAGWGWVGRVGRVGRGLVVWPRRRRCGGAHLLPCDGRDRSRASTARDDGQAVELTRTLILTLALSLALAAR